MVYRRRTRTKGYRRRRRTYNKRMYPKRRYRRGPKTYYFKRHCQFSPIATTNVLGFLGAFTFQLADLPNTQEFKDLFDSYQLRGVKIKFRPQQTENISLSAVNNAYGSSRFYSAIDYNNATSPTSADTLREYSTVKLSSILSPHSRYFKPRTIDANGANPGVRTWLPTSNDTIKHYGLRVAIEPTLATAPSTSMAFSIECCYYLAFRSVV